MADKIVHIVITLNPAGKQTNQKEFDSIDEAQQNIDMLFIRCFPSGLTDGEQYNIKPPVYCERTSTMIEFTTQADFVYKLTNTGAIS